MAQAEDNLGNYGALFFTPHSFALDEGASVRRVYPTGIRFEAGISEEDKANLSTNAQFGTLVTLDSHLQGQALTFQTGTYVDIPTNVWLESSSLGEGYQGYYSTIVGGTGTGAEGDYVDFEPQHYGDVFVARGYVIDGGVVHYTSNTVERTIAGVAERAIEEGDTSEYLAEIVESAPKISLRFDAQNDEEPTTQTCVKGSILTETDIPTPPTRVGYRFDGWYTDEACTDGNEFSFSGILKKDTVAYAKWTATGISYDENALRRENNTLIVNIFDEHFTEGNYLVTDVTVNSRSQLTYSNTPTDRLLTNDDNATNGFLIYDENNHLVAERQVLSGKCRAVLKITDTEKDTRFTIGANTDLSVEAVSIYTPQSFLTEIAENKQTATLATTAYDLVTQGRSDYTIVLPATPQGYEEKAALELQEYFYLATGVELPIKSEEEVVWSQNSKLLAVGNTKYATAEGLLVPIKQFGARGFRIRQKNSNVLLLGGDTMGTLCAVYEFLHYQFDFEAYALGYSAFEKGVTEKKLLAFDLEEIPDAEYTHGYYREEYRDDALEMRFNYHTDIFVDATGQPWHNTLDYLPKSVYGSQHSKWYVEDGSQLHYSAHGDAAELEAMREAVYSVMKNAIDEAFAQGKYYEYIGFIHEDNDNFASDSSVADFKTTYGDAYEAAMVIQFINPIAERLQAYMAENHGGREMNIVIGGYRVLDDVPVQKTSTGYEPIDDSVRLASNVQVLIADIKSDYAREFQYANNLTEKTAKWKALTDDRMPLYWFYDYYAYGLIYFDNTYNLKNILSLGKNSPFVFNETVEPYGTNPFGPLKTYLTSKLSWDSEADVNALIDGFFDDYFGVAGESMWRLFDRMLSHIGPLLDASSDSSRVNVIHGGDRLYYDSANQWTKEIADELMAYIRQAYADIQPLQTTSPEEYQALKDRIDRESLMFRYLLLQYHASETYTQAEFTAEKEEFKAICARLGITQWSYVEGDISSYIDSISYD